MVSYKKLLKLLEERKISKTKFAADIGISSDTMAKLSKDEPVKMVVLSRICRYLAVTPNDVMEIVETGVIAPLLFRLVEEKNSNISNGIYHETQIAMTYNSNHIEGSKLSEEQTRYIFETATIVNEGDNIVLVDDIIETVNHFECIRYLLDHAMDPLSEEIIKTLHKILKTGTTSARLEWFNVGDYKKVPNIVGGEDTCPPHLVAGKIQTLIGKYNLKKDITFENIVDFHCEFEKIHPFQDGNGRIGRLIAFKECLKQGHVPFIIDEEIKLFYYRGLREYKKQKSYLIDTCLSGQDKYKKILDKFELEY